jgi:hypothetical protein
LTETADDSAFAWRLRHALIRSKSTGVSQETKCVFCVLHPHLAAHPSTALPKSRIPRRRAASGRTKTQAAAPYQDRSENLDNAIMPIGKNAGFAREAILRLK